jgi:protein AbiQ
MKPILCYIKENYFTDHKDFKKMLDPGNISKQSKRTYLCVEIEIDDNKYYIPLRNNLGEEIRKFGRIGHSVPSEKRKNAGLDYRYALIINDSKYIELQKEIKIPNSQYRCIKNSLEIIQKEFKIYLNGYIRAVKKKRNEKEPLYRESSLINFVDVFKM